MSLLFNIQHLSLYCHSLTSSVYVALSLQNFHHKNHIKFSIISYPRFTPLKTKHINTIFHLHLKLYIIKLQTATTLLVHITIYPASPRNTRTRQNHNTTSTDPYYTLAPLEPHRTITLQVHPPYYTLKPLEPHRTITLPVHIPTTPWRLQNHTEPLHYKYTLPTTPWNLQNHTEP